MCFWRFTLLFQHVFPSISANWSRFSTSGAGKCHQNWSISRFPKTGIYHDLWKHIVELSFSSKCCQLCCIPNNLNNQSKRVYSLQIIDRCAFSLMYLYIVSSARKLSHKNGKYDQLNCWISSFLEMAEVFILGLMLLKCSWFDSIVLVMAAQ